jgi:hypothetical protein
MLTAVWHRRRKLLSTDGVKEGLGDERSRGVEVKKIICGPRSPIIALRSVENGQLCSFTRKSPVSSQASDVSTDMPLKHNREFDSSSSHLLRADPIHAATGQQVLLWFDHAGAAVSSQSSNSTASSRCLTHRTDLIRIHRKRRSIEHRSIAGNTASVNVEDGITHASDEGNTVTTVGRFVTIPAEPT